jgi:hypothetical protein
MVADVPKLTPVTKGCVPGVVAPPGILTLAGTVAVVGSELTRVTVIPVAGAFDGRDTLRAAVPPKATANVDGKVIVPALWTVTFAVASGMLGSELAWITADPKAAPVTGTRTVLVPAANVAVDPTVAFPLLELRFTVRPVAGAFADSVSVRF